MFKEIFYLISLLFKSIPKTVTIKSLKYFPKNSIYLVWCGIIFYNIELKTTAESMMKYKEFNNIYLTAQNSIYSAEKYSSWFKYYITQWFTK